MSTKGWESASIPSSKVPNTAALNVVQRARKRGGSSWEAEIEGTNKVYRFLGVADIRRREPRVIWTGKVVNGWQPARRVGTLGVDFEGFVTPNGRAVVVEVKSCTHPVRWSLAQVTIAELEHLRSAVALGALAGVLLAHRLPTTGVIDSAWWLPAAEVLAWRLEKRPSVEWSWLQAEHHSWRVYRTQAIPWDYLAAAKEEENARQAT